MFKNILTLQEVKVKKHIYAQFVDNLWITYNIHVENKWKYRGIIVNRC